MLVNLGSAPQQAIVMDVNQYVQLINLMSNQNQNAYLYWLIFEWTNPINVQAHSFGTIHNQYMYLGTSNKF